MLDRAQTETLGFIFVFALIVSMIGVIFTTGFGGLQDVREAERLNNAERAFEVLADNVEDLIHRYAPSRATEIKVSGASLGFTDSIEVEVDVEGSAFNTTTTIDPIRYKTDQGAIFYSTGAVLRMDGENGLVVSESTFLLDENRTLIPLVQTRATGSGSVGGETTALLRTEVADRTIIHSNKTAGTGVWINVTSPRAATWRAHFDGKSDVNCEPVSGDTASCLVTTDRVLVTLSRIDVSLT